MSILIKGMEMPETCSDCEWSYYVGNGRAMCRRVSKTDKTDIMTKRRADFCPLTEINTPHGRLGDLDALYEEISNGNKAYNGIEGYDGEYQHIGNVDDCMDVIKMADTVIEAEGSET